MVRECCSSRPVTKQAQGAVRGIESSPRVPRGELSGRFAPRRKETKKEHRSFGTIIETRGRFKVRYTGPDRQLHRAGITFTTRERAQGWLSDERKLIELNEWAPPVRRRAPAAAKNSYSSPATATSTSPCTTKKRSTTARETRPTDGRAGRVGRQPEVTLLGGVLHRDLLGQVVIPRSSGDLVQLITPSRSEF